MKISPKQWKKHLIKRWLGEILLDSDDLAWAWDLADKLMFKLESDPKHWGYKALENKRRGFTGERAFDNLCGEAGLDHFWANPGGMTWGEESLRAYDFHIAKKQMKDGDMEIKTLEAGDQHLAIKDIGWKHSEANYVVIFEFMNPEILNSNIEEIKAKSLTATLKLVGYLSKAQVDAKKATPDTFWSSRKFKRSEFKSPRTILRKLIKEENARWSMWKTECQ